MIGSGESPTFFNVFLNIVRHLVNMLYNLVLRTYYYHLTTHHITLMVTRFTSYVDRYHADDVHASFSRQASPELTYAPDRTSTFHQG